MATTTRAGGNTYTTTLTGGTRDPGLVMRDLPKFFDAVEVQDTEMLDMLKKVAPIRQRKVERGSHALTPRTATVGAAALATANSVTLTAGHGTRINQGSVLLVTNGAGEQERVRVTADPAGDVLTVARAQGGDTAIAFEVGNTVSIFSTAMPERASYPLIPLTTGDTTFNYPQRIMGYVDIDKRADNTPTYEWDGATHFERMMMDLAAKLKRDLNGALISGRRQDGDPNPSAPVPSMLGGVIQMAELSGNTFNAAGGLLAPELIENVLSTIDLAYGSNAGTKLIMSHSTKRILNRIMTGKKTRADLDEKKASFIWDSAEFESATVSFAKMRDFPDGSIVFLDPSELGLAPYAGCDWQEQVLPVDAPLKRTGVFGDFTLIVNRPKTMAILSGFNQSLAAYPTF